MKKALKILVIYIAYFLIVILIGIGAYLAYLNVTNFSAGKPGLIFSKTFFSKAFFYVCACSCFFICPFVVTYRIRHKGGIVQILMYIFLCAINWGVLFPFFTSKANQTGYEDLYIHPKSISAGYFRKADNRIFYFTEDALQDAPASTVLIIDTQKENAVEVTKLSPKEDFVLFTQAEPYNDVFTKSAFPNDESVNILGFRTIIKNAAEALEGGLFGQMALLSLALALCSLYGLTNLFDWKLLNTVFILLMTFGLLVCNSLYYSAGFEPFKMKYLSGGLFGVLSLKITDSPLFIFNMIISFVCILTGITVYFVKKNRT